MLVLTDRNSVIGGYCPDEWECTTGAKNSRGWLDRKDVVSGWPFLFYFLDDKIEIIKHTDVPSMRSDKDWLMVLGGGFMLIKMKDHKHMQMIIILFILKTLEI